MHFSSFSQAFCISLHFQRHFVFLFIFRGVLHFCSFSEAFCNSLHFQRYFVFLIFRGILYFSSLSEAFCISLHFQRHFCSERHFEVTVMIYKAQTPNMLFTQSCCCWWWFCFESVRNQMNATCDCSIFHFISSACWYKLNPFVPKTKKEEKKNPSVC